MGLLRTPRDEQWQQERQQQEYKKYKPFLAARDTEMTQSPRPRQLCRKHRTCQPAACTAVWWNSTQYWSIYRPYPTTPSWMALEPVHRRHERQTRELW